MLFRYITIVAVCISNQWLSHYNRVMKNLIRVYPDNSCCSIGFHRNFVVEKFQISFVIETISFAILLYLGIKWYSFFDGKAEIFSLYNDKNLSVCRALLFLSILIALPNVLF